MLLVLPVEVAQRMAKVLVVEDDPIVAMDIQRVLQQAGHDTVGTAGSAERALSLAERHRPDVVFVDLQLAGGTDGVEVAVLLAERYDCGIIVATGSSGAVVDNTRVHDLAEAVLQKPFSEQQILEAMTRCLDELEEPARQDEAARPG